VCSICAIKVGTIPSRIVPEKPNFGNHYVEKKIFFLSHKKNVKQFKINKNEKKTKKIIVLIFSQNQFLKQKTEVFPLFLRNG
jgi:hypothetical protein